MPENIPGIHDMSQLMQQYPRSKRMIPASGPGISENKAEYPRPNCTPPVWGHFALRNDRDIPRGARRGRGKNHPESKFEKKSHQCLSRWTEADVRANRDVVAVISSTSSAAESTFRSRRVLWRGASTLVSVQGQC